MDIMKSTDVTTAILLSPCPEDGVLVELRLLMGTLDFHKKKETGYFVHIYEQVPNDLPRNLASGVDAHLAQGSDKDRESEDTQPVGFTGLQSLSIPIGLQEIGRSSRR